MAAVALVELEPEVVTLTATIHGTDIGSLEAFETTGTDMRSNKNANRVAISVAIVSGIAGGASTQTGMAGGNFDHCTREVVNEVKSPVADVVSFAIKTNCGATAPFVLSAHIRDTNDSRDYRDDYFLLLTSATRIEFVWDPVLKGSLSLPSLTVSHDEPRHVMRKAVVWDGIQIEYVQER